MQLGCRRRGYRPGSVDTLAMRFKTKRWARRASYLLSGFSGDKLSPNVHYGVVENWHDSKWLGGKGKGGLGGEGGGARGQRFLIEGRLIIAQLGTPWARANPWFRSLRQLNRYQGTQLKQPESYCMPHGRKILNVCDYSMYKQRQVASYGSSSVGRSCTMQTPQLSCPVMFG